MEYSHCWQRSQRLRKVDGGHAMGQWDEFAYHLHALREAEISLCYWRHELLGELRPVTAASSSLPGEMGSDPPHQGSGAGVREPPRELGKCLLGSGGPRDYPSPTPEKF